MSVSPVLSLTLMSANQAQKEVVFNEFLIAMDALFRGSVLDASLHIPPASPNEGDAYIINTGATGLWSGYDNQIAFYYNGWQFITPPLKITLYNVAANAFYQFNGGALLGGTFLWVLIPNTTVAVLNDLTDVSITSPTNKEVLTYNSSTSKWNAAPATFTATLESLTDVSVTEGSAIDQFVLYWNNTDGKWEAKALAAPPTFLTLPDVSLTGVGNGYLLEYTTTGPGVKFINPTSIISVLTLANVGDVTYGSGLTVGDVLQWNGSAWAPQILSTLTLAGLSDVLVTEGSGINGCVLTWNESAGKWVPDVPSGGGGSSTLAGLTDVSVTEGSGLDGKVLYWKNADTKWEAESIAAVALSGAYADLTGKPTIPGNSSFNLSGLGDVTITSLATGQVPTWNGTKWVNQTPSTGGGGSSTLAGDSDVLITSPSNGQVLTYSSSASKWQNATPASEGGLFNQVLSATPTASSTGLSTWVNQGSSTTANAATGLQLIAPYTGASNNVRALVGATLPSTPYTITALLCVTRLIPTYYDFVGIGFMNPSTGAAQLFGLYSVNGAPCSIAVVDFSNATTPHDVAYETASNATAYRDPIWLRLYNDGTTVHFSFSYDGSYFMELFTTLVSSGFMSSNGGYANACVFANPISVNTVVTVASWALT